MRRFKWSCIAFIVMVALWAGLAATHWLPLTTSAQRKARAILAAPPVSVHGKRNAFAAIWLSDLDVPAADLERIAAEDASRYRTLAPDRRLAFESEAAGRYREERLDTPARAPLCLRGEADCLGLTRRLADDARAVLAEHPRLLAHARSLADEDYYHEAFGGEVESVALPRPDLGSLARSDAALAFIDGDRAGGLARACQGAATARQLTLHNDQPVMQEAFAVDFIAATRLVAALLAEMPREAALPVACGEAYAPIPDAALSVCDSMKAQFRAVTSLLRPPSSIGARLFFNERASSDAMAPGYARFCADDADIARAARQTHAASGPWSACGLSGIAFNLAGCMVAQIGDAQAMNQGLLEGVRNVQRAATILGVALRWRADASARLPAGITLDAPSRTLRTRLADRRGGAIDFMIPLPGSKLP